MLNNYRYRGFRIVNQFISKELVSNVISSRPTSDMCQLKLNVHFADGARRNFTDTVVPPIGPPTAELQAFLGDWRRHSIQLPVVRAAVIRFTSAPVGVPHLRHLKSAAA